MGFSFRPPRFEDESVKLPRAQEKFIALGLHSSEDARKAGSYHRAQSVLDEAPRRLCATEGDVQVEDGALASASIEQWEETAAAD